MAILATDRRSQRHRGSAAFGLSIPGFSSRYHASATRQNLDIAYFQCSLCAGCRPTTRISNAIPSGVAFSFERGMSSGAVFLKIENLCLVVAHGMKKLVPNWSSLVLSSAPHDFQADFPSGGYLPLSHHGIVHFISSPNATITTLFAMEGKRVPNSGLHLRDPCRDALKSVALGTRLCQ